MAQDKTSFSDTIALVGRAQEGDDQALESLFRRYLPRVRQVAAVRLGKMASQLLEVEDVVQEAMLSAFRDLDDYVRSEGRFCHWLAGIVENRIRMHLRSASSQKHGGGKVQRFADRNSTLASSRLPGHEASPSQHVMAREVDERVQRALLALEPRLREVFLQRMVCKMSYEEIAEQMGLERASSARALFSRALPDLGKRTGTL